MCDPFALLSRITGKIFAPKDSHQYCCLATDTGVVSFSKFSEQFKEYETRMIIAIMSHLELCLEINALEHNIADRHLFFPGLIRIDSPEKVWEEAHGELAYHFGWILQCSQDIECFNPRCLQVLILRIVHTFGLCTSYHNTRQPLPPAILFCVEKWDQLVQ